MDKVKYDLVYELIKISDHLSKLMCLCDLSRYLD